MAPIAPNTSTIFDVIGEEMIIDARVVTVNRVIRDTMGWIAEGTDSDDVVRMIVLDKPMEIPIVLS